MEQRYGIPVNLRRTGAYKRPVGTPFAQISDALSFRDDYYATWLNMFYTGLLIIAMFIISKWFLGWDHGLGRNYMILPMILIDVALFLLIFQTATQNETKGTIYHSGYTNLKQVLSVLFTDDMVITQPVNDIAPTGEVEFANGKQRFVKCYKVQGLYNTSMFDEVKESYVSRNLTMAMAIKVNQGIGSTTIVADLNMSSYFPNVRDASNNTRAAQIYKNKMIAILGNITDRQALETYVFATAKSPKQLAQMKNEFERNLSALVTSYRPLDDIETEELIRKVII